MNKNLYRIVFNARRGIRMAVAEIAASQGKSASGETQGATAGPMYAMLKPLALSLAMLGLSPWVTAQIVVDRSAPGNQQPTLLQTANGLPQVNIQTPSAGGVSRNVYTQFDVQSQGVILNNSMTNVQTQLGGYVQSNPWLTGGSARVILNEINSNSPSQIRGFVEVAGQRAEVIIANSAGIAVNGGGFINASAVTLTTGTPVMNGGNLESFRVRSGNVTISGAGLDTSTADYTNILARGVQVNAGIWAKDLKIVTGTNKIDASNASNPQVMAAETATDVAPAFAIDVAQLGGMYAGKIFLVGTEAGLGVRNAGTLSASSGDLVISNNGWLSNSGTVYAGGNTSITTQGDIANTGSGLIAAQGNVTLDAQGTMTSTSGGTTSSTTSQVTSEVTASIIAGMDSQGAVGTTGNLQATAAGTMALLGQVASGGDTSLSATALDLSGATLGARDVSLTASTGDINATQASVTASGTLTTDAAQTLRTDGATVSAKHFVLQAHDISNVGGQLRQTGTDDMTVALAGNLDNTDGTIATNATNLNLSATTLTNLRGKILHAGTGTAQINATDLQGTSGQLLSNGTLNVNATHITVDQGTTAAANVAIQTNSLSNQGGLLVGSDSLHVTADTVDNTGGRLHSDADLTLDLAQSLNNTDGLITGGQLTVRDTAATPAVRALAVTNTRGTLLAGQTLTVNAASVDSSGSLLSQGDMALDVQGNLTNSGSILASTNATVVVGGTITHSGTLQAGNTVDVTTQNLDAAATAEISGATTKLHVAGTLTNQGLIDSGTATGTGETQIDAGTLHNTGAGRIYGDNVSIAATTLTNDAQTVGGVTTAATIAARQQLDIGVSTLDNLQGASILSLGDMAIGGALDTSRRATGAATTVTNSASTIEAQGALTIQSGAINNLNPDIQWTNDAGTQSGSGTLYFTPQGTFDSADGAVLSSSSGSLVGMSHGGVAYYQIVSWDPEYTCTGIKTQICTPTGNMIATYAYGKGAAQANSSSGAVTFDSFATYTQTDYHAVVTKSTPGRIASGGDMNLITTGTLLNDQSEIVAGGALNIVAANVNNNARTITINNVRNGTAYAWSQYDEGCGDVKGCSYNYQAYKPSDYTSYIAHTEILDIHVTRDHANGATANRSVGTATTRSVGSVAGPSTSSVNSVSGNGGSYSVPTSSLYKINTSSTAHYLVATDPRFTSYQNWLSSDYITSQLAMDPTVTQKRLGDGYYEQRLINDQVAELTGRRFLDNYTSDQQQYQALMDAGITYAQNYNLREGVALTAEQIARLTSDIVWLQQENVTLPDGTITQALVPHVYLAVNDGDLAPSGALLGGNTVNITSTGDITNSGTILGRQLVSLDANNISNLNGQIKGQSVLLSAAQDVNNVGGTIQAVDTLAISAGRDLNVTTTTQSTSGQSGNYAYSQTGIDRVAGLYVTGSNGVLVASAGNDMNLIAAQINSAGTAQLQAGNDVNLGTVVTSQSNNFGAGNADHHVLNGQSMDVGSQIQGSGNVTISAGNDVNAKAAGIQAGDQARGSTGDLVITANNNVNIVAGEKNTTFDSAIKVSTSGMFSSGSIATRDTAETTSAVSSNLGGTNVNIVSGKDLTVKASNVVADQDTTLVAGNNVNIEAAQNSQTSSHSVKKTESGFSMDVQSGPGMTTSEQALNAGDITVTDTGSTIRAGGNLSVQAGNSIAGTAATLDAGGTASLIAQGNIVLQEGRTTLSADVQQSSSKQGTFSGTETQIHDTRDSSTALASKVSGAQGVTMQAQNGTLYLSDAQVSSSAGDIKLSGADVIISSALNSTSTSHEEHTSTTGVTLNDMMGTFKPGQGMNHDVKDTADNSSTTLAQGTVNGQNITITSTGGADSQLSLRAVGVNATGNPTGPAAQPGTIALDAGAGTLNLQTIQTTNFQATSTTESDIAWQSNKGSGSQTQDTAYTQINGQLSATAASIHVEGPQASLQEAAAQLAAQPGMAWLNQLQNDPQLAGKVDWNKIDEINKNWHYDQSGLTPAGASILAIVVTYFTAGAASGAAGAMVTEAGITGTAATMTSAALAAGMTTLASQTAVALVNNQGDIGKTLEQMGSDASIKSLLTAMVTAGALQELSIQTINGQPLNNINVQNSSFGSLLGKTLINNVASATITTAINGGSLEDNLKTGLVNAFVSTASAEASFAIGQNTDMNSLANYTAHAIAGCVSGAATASAGGGCSAGAIGAAVGEAAAIALNSGRTSEEGVNPNTAQFAGMMSALAVAAAGGTAAQISIAQVEGTNAATNNYLTTTNLRSKFQKIAACGKDATCTDRIKQEAVDQSIANNNKILDACTTGGTASCQQAISTAQSDRDGLISLKATLQTNLDQASGATDVTALRAQIKDLDYNIKSANSIIAEATNILNGGVVSTADLTLEERMKIGFALDIVEGTAGAKLGQKLGDSIKNSFTAPSGTVIAVPANASLSNVEARQWYLEQEARIPSLLDQGASLETQAQQAWQLRNTFRTATRNAMADQETAAQLNVTNPNLTWDQTVQKYSENSSGDQLWQQIISSSQRSNAIVNKNLGVTPITKVPKP